MPSCVPQVLPNYISWLTSLCHFNCVSQHLELLFEFIFLTMAIIRKQLMLAPIMSFLRLESYEASDGNLYLFFLFRLKDLIYFFVYFLQLRNVVIGNASSALREKIYESAIVVSELHGRNFAFTIEVVKFFW